MWLCQVDGGAGSVRMLPYLRLPEGGRERQVPPPHL